MHFVKARKHLEEADSKDRQEKSRRDRYQRSDSARLVLQALTHQHPTTKAQTDEGKIVSKQIPGVRSSLDAIIGLSSNASRSDFKPEELPDGACYRPKKDLRNLPASSSTSVVSAAPTTTAASSVSLNQIQVENVPSAAAKPLEFTRRAEYIGTFAVSGSNKEAREQQMESQLEQMRSARESRPVSLIISNQGVKVVLQENNNVFMEHSLKRIWYATCDPEYCQFSFLAREPKTSAEVQYCHAFVTQSAEQAEELIAIIGEAFKSTDNEAKKPPTFHELIEQQVQQQQAKFRETQKEAQSALQQKLKEIATPTPFSERAQIRMEQRRKSEDVTQLVEQEKLWAQQPTDASAAMNQPSPDRSGGNVPGNRRSEIPTRHVPQSSPLKRNSVPMQAAILTNPVPSSSSPSPLSVMAIKESIENKNSNTKFKGSPVTALKNEIDKRLSMTNGDDLDLAAVIDWELRKDQAKPPKQQPKPMSNRPLPPPPNSSRSPQQSRHQLASSQQPLQQSNVQSQRAQQPSSSPFRALLRHSLDDYHIPRSSSSQIPLSSRGGVGNVVMRDSPKRRQPRPMSEIATSSSGVIDPSLGRGQEYSEQQRQAIFSNLAAGFNLSPHPEVSTMQQEGRRPPPHPSSPEGSLNNPGQNTQKTDSPRPSESSQPHAYQSRLPSGISGQGHVLVGQISRQESVSDQGAVNLAALRYQNDSPFQNDRSEKGSKQSSGFESLMCLDRSHIHDEALRSASWYHAGLPREIALEILQQEEVGAFIVRDSTSHPGCYALSVRVPKYENPSGISHYLILRTHTGVKLKGLGKEWSNLAALVTHHTVMKELLPCTLRLPKVKSQLENQSPLHRLNSGDLNQVDGNSSKA